MGIRLLILGSKGQLGYALMQHAKPALQEALDAVVAHDADTLDVTNPDALVNVLKDVRPDVIVNAAAYTAVEKAEDDPKSAFAVNAEAVGVMAEQAKKQGCVLVHYSTDYVFDGKKQSPYLETDLTNPLSVYGQSKAKGEDYLREIGGNWVIFRTSWVFAQRGGNFCKTMIKLAQERDELRIVDDQQGAPTSANFLAELGLQVAGVVAASRYRQLRQLEPSILPMSPNSLPSQEIFHATSAGCTTWFDYAELALTEAKLQGLIEKAPTLTRVKTDTMNFKAARPAYSVLSNQKLINTFHIAPPEWGKAVKHLIASLSIEKSAF